MVRYWWLPVSRKSMNSVDIVHRHNNKCLAGVLECEQCPLSPWTMTTQSMGSVHSVHGQCPLSPWTMSTESMDIVHSVHGLFPWVYTTLHLIKNYSNPTKLNAYIQFKMLVIYISWHTMPICPSILIDLLTVSSPSHKNMYCVVVTLFIIFWKIITNWWSKCCCKIISSI